MKKNIIYMPEDHMDKLYKAKNFLVRYVHNNRLQNIINQFPNDDKLCVLDAGCGEGHLLEKLVKKNQHNLYYGADLTEVAIIKAKERCPEANYLLTDLVSIDLSDNFFDIIVCTETIEHIQNYQIVLQEFKRLLKPNGFLILTFPNEFWWTVSRLVLGRRPVRVIDHVNFFSINKIKQVVDLPVVKAFGLPWHWPFILSLGGLVKFKKS